MPARKARTTEMIGYALKKESGPGWVGIGSESLKYKISAERAHHHDVSMGEVDHEEDTVDQGIADGDQGIDAAENKTVNGEPDPGIRAIGGMRDQDVV